MELRQVTKNGNPMWLVDIPKTAAGKRTRIFRETKSAALQAANEAIEEFQKHGTAGEISTRERAFIGEWRGKLGGWDAISVILRQHDATGARTVAKASADYLAERAKRKLSERHISDVKSRLKAFTEAFGDRLIPSIKPGELTTYCESKGGSGPNHYRVLRALFSHANLHEWVTIDPMARVEKPEPITEEKELLSPTLMTAALRISAGLSSGMRRSSRGKAVAARYEPMLITLVLGGFFGLRDSEIARLDRSRVDVARGEIHITKMKTSRKGIRERYVIGPPNAQEWLRALNLPASGLVLGGSRRRIYVHRTHLCKTLGITWPHNVLRRSFGSYHLAAFQNAALTAELMGHTDAETTKAKYRVPRRKEIGEEWFALTPETVL